MNKISIFWFRRDLRLHDNAGLFHALKSEGKVLPIFIFDPNILDKLPKSDARVTFIYKALNELNDHLQTFETKIKIYYGSPSEVFALLTDCLLYTSPSPRDLSTSRMPSSA